jgi:predicted PurR-regulated permease PerM
MLGFDARAARATWTVAVVLLALWLVYLVRSTLFIFVLAVLFAYLLAPLVDLLDRFLPGTRSRTLALALANVLMVVLVVLSAVAIGSRLVQEATELAKSFPAIMGGWMNSFQARLPQTLNLDLSTRFNEMISSLPKLALEFLGLAGNLVYVVIIPVLAFFFLKDGHLIYEHALGLVSVGPRRALLEGVLEDLHLLLAHYMRALVLLSLGTFTAYSIFLTIIGIPYGILLGTLAAVLEFIPMIGPLSGVAIVMIVAAASGGPVLAVLIFAVAFRLFQDYFASPHLMGRGVELHPLLVLLGVFAGAELAGVAGTLLSVPVLALGRIIYRRAWQSRVARD